MELLRARRSLRNDVIALGRSRFFFVVEWVWPETGGGWGLALNDTAGVEVILLRCD